MPAFGEHAHADAAPGLVGGLKVAVELLYPLALGLGEACAPLELDVGVEHAQVHRPVARVSGVDLLADLVGSRELGRDQEVPDRAGDIGVSFAALVALQDRFSVRLVPSVSVTRSSRPCARAK